MMGESSDRWDVLVYERVYGTLYAYGLPVICLIGFIGNVMNLLILTGRRIQYSLRARERSANACLIALAVADMAFCISAFPSTFLPQDMTFDRRSFLAYYACYCAAVINVFIMTSTWLTVVMSTERYLAICHPLKSRNFISLKRTKTVIVIVCLASVVFNVPVFWRYSILSTMTDDNDTDVVRYRVMHTGTDELFDHTYRGLWAVLGNFIPLLFLVLCNTSLALEIHRSYDLRQRMNAGRTLLTTEPTARRRRRRSSSHSSADHDASSRITVTLVSIVVMFFVLVAPSEIVKQIAYLVGGDLSHNYTYMTIEVVTNVMQTVNFAANFVLYCIVNPPFRKVMREMTSCVWRRKRRRSKGQCAHKQLLLQSLTSERSPCFRHQILLVRDTWYRDVVTSTAYYSSSFGAGGLIGGGNSRKKNASVVIEYK